ncbi:MAG: hypothetical protein LBS85_08455 [Clostridiales Family XIII bacterium]|nr:hypothetical protein [Clostridiales Family XIII bacterium]
MGMAGNRGFDRINLMMTIARRGVGDSVIEDLRGMGVTYNMVCVGESMGGLGLADYMGFEDDEFDIILSVVTDGKADRAIALIEYGYSEIADGGAVAALMPITGVSGPLVLEYIAGPPPGGG